MHFTTIRRFLLKRMCHTKWSHIRTSILRSSTSELWAGFHGETSQLHANIINFSIVILSFSYLQADWWVRSHAPARSFPSLCRCTSCTASTGQSGPPHRSDWPDPPAGWARPSGPSPPRWTCTPYPPAAQRWQSLSWCACACFQVGMLLLSESSSPDMKTHGSVSQGLLSSASFPQSLFSFSLAT